MLGCNKLQEQRYSFDHEDTSFVFYDISNSTSCILHEVCTQDSYKLKQIQFAPGDVVLDIGANIGVLSILLAKKFPYLKVLAFEPLPSNYQYLQRNIKENAVSNVHAFPLAITADGRFQEFRCMTQNLGGANAYITNDEPFMVAQAASVTLKHVFDAFGLDKVKLLKIDCEGGEYEIIPSIPKDYLERIEYLSGEFHTLFGHQDPTELLQYCHQIFQDKMAISIF